jgi:tRNA (cytidine32/uridine32-2'-O)-methyltransferase
MARVRFRIVLVRPRYGGNVGSTVRVAANFGVKEVVLVDPGCALEEDPEYVRMAMGGDRLVTLRTTATLADAVADTQAAVATTSTRSRDTRAVLTPAETAQRLAGSGAEDIALVFGSERGGLSLDELRACHMALSIPTDPGFPVLNLAQAVGIVLALLPAGAFARPAPSDPMDLPAPHAEFSAALAHLDDALLASGYLDPQNPARVGDQFRRWLGRTVPTRRELALLHALAAHVSYLLGRSTPRS